MDEKIYPLSDLPFEQAATIKAATRFIKTSNILNSLEKRYCPPKRLRALIEIAIQQNEIQAVQGRYYDGTVAYFINLKNLCEEFSAFADKINHNKLGMSLSDFNKNINRLENKTHEKSSYRRKLSRHFYSNPACLTISEHFFSKPESFIHAISRSRFAPTQNFAEIRDLCNFLLPKRPRNVLEIGTKKGGTFYLLAKVSAPEATLATIDLRINRKNTIKCFAQKKQKAILIEQDSASPLTIENIQRIFPEGLDFLFIDGDHSYEGVKKDFLNYSPFVVSGGFIGFHDIV